MNTSNLKRYAPLARTAFIEAVTQRAQLFGISNNNIAEATITGEVMMINGKPFEANLKRARDKLVQRVNAIGFEPLMDQMAYTWFNRLCAIRYMELHDYLGHGLRVLSHPTNPNNLEILEQAQDVAEELGLDRTHIMELKVAGNQDEQLYRELLVGQCRQLHKAMPFLFETINDETELLLPTNLTRTDSMIRQLVYEIPEQEWQQVEIIGWLYQFYISEKKDEVIGKVVKSEDIPAATQLFTPNWIVKYMVQNSLGAQWLATYPDSPIKGEMEYYIEPAEQTDEVNAQLAAITPSSLDPEKLTLIDPACGSGHILVEAYELFKAIYLERGYRQRDIPQLILENNLFGLDIDQRAAQLTSFALMMKGRADDRRLFERGVVLNVMALVDSTDFDADELAQMVPLSDHGLKPSDLTELKRLFEHATTFGALIQVSKGLASSLPALKQLSEAASQDLFVSDALKGLGLLMRQAEMLAAQYDAVVANPPYMGGKAMNSRLKGFASEHFPNSKSDLFAVSTERFLRLARAKGFIGLMTPFTWMFLKSYEVLRELVLRDNTIQSLIQPQYHTMFESAAVPICTFVIRNIYVSGYEASFIKLTDFYGAERQPKKTLEAINNADCGWFYRAKPDDFELIPRAPLVYWVSDAFRSIFELPKVGDFLTSDGQILTGNNDLFLRHVWEVDSNTVGRSGNWKLHHKGGDFRKWCGNVEWVVAWGEDAREFFRQNKTARIPKEELWDLQGITWSTITSSHSSFRRVLEDESFNKAAPTLISAREELIPLTLGALNSKVAQFVMSVINPTLNCLVHDVEGIPLVSENVAQGSVVATTEACLRVAATDWNAYERSWDFQSLPLLSVSTDSTPPLESSYTAWIESNRDTITEMKRLEEENNRLPDYPQSSAKS